MAIRTMFSRLGLVEPGFRDPVIPAARRLQIDLAGTEAIPPLAAPVGPRPAPTSSGPVVEPAGTTPLAPVAKAPAPSLDAPRPVTATNDAATAVEDGAPTVIAVLNNDVGVAAIARINGVAVAAGGSVTLQSGARVIVNADGTLSYEVGTAFQSLGAGQTAQDVFTYTGVDGGGSPIAPEGVFNAAAINGANGFVVHGAAAGDRSGYSVAGIGDINGDGHDDLLIGALSADPTGRTDAGTSYVVYGRQGGFGASLDLGQLTAATGFAITGVNAFDYSGASVRAAGDVNGDGLADFLIGAPWGEAGQGTNAGETYLIFGRAGGFGASLDLSTLNGTNGVTFRGGAAGDGLGFAVASAGDINGDGFDDLILGAREANGGGDADSGASYVVFGRAGGFTAGIDVAGLTGATGFAILGLDPSDRSGHSVSAAGDVNGDGVDDLVIGAPQGDPGGRANAGEAYVVFGRLGGFGASLDLGALTGANGFTISGVDAGDHAGWSVASAGDLNGDGLGDLVIGALYADPAGRDNAGETYVVFGRAGGFGANLDLSNMTPATGFVITGTAALNLTGHSVASAGDVNGDGIGDLLIGALYADGTGGADAGETYVVFGRQGGFGGVLDLASLNGQTGFAIGGVAGGDYSGHSVAAAGDVNGDGFDDLIIGAPMASPSGRINAGSSYVLFGAANVTRLSNDATVTVTVTGVNDAPVITSNGGGATGGYTIAEDTQGPNPLTAFDPDAGSNLTFAIIGGADAALFTINGGVLQFINAPDFEAPADLNGDNVYEVIVQVSDGALTDTQTLNVTVTNVNEAPVITSNGGGATGGYIIAENTLGPNTLTAVDPDAGANLTFSIIGGADAALFTINGGVLQLINPPDFEAPADQNGDNVYEVIVQVSDGALTDTQTISLTVTDGNEAPVITSGGGGPSAVVTGVENSTTATTVVAADPDAGASLVFSIITGRDGARFAIDSVTGVLTFVSAPDFEAPTDQNNDGVYEVDVLVSDGLGGEDVQTIFVNVGNANEAPVISSSGDYADFENGLGTIQVVANDPDAGTTLTYAIIGGPDAALFAIDASGRIGIVNPQDFENPADQNGDNVYEVVVQVSDGQLTDTQTVRLTVLDANEAPVITSNGGGATGGYTIFENTLGPNTITAVDQDAGANVAYSIIGGADAALFTMTGGVLQLINPPDFEAPADQNGDNVYEVIVQASDGTLTDTQTISLTVTNANEAPVITSDGGGASGTVMVAEGVRSVTTVVAADPDAGAQITYAIIGGADATLFTIDSMTGAVTFVTNPDFEAPADSNGDNIYDIVVQASDGVNSDTQNLAVTVTNVAEAGPPVLTDLTTALTFSENFVNSGDRVLDGFVTFTDTDGDYDGGSLTLTGVLAEDRVSVRNQGSGTGQVGLAGSSVTWGGVVIGALTGGAGADLIITFNADATSEAIDAVIQNLTYANVSDTPTFSRLLTLNVTDAAGNELSTTGYIERSGPANPFSGIDLNTSAPALADLDGDGDLDAVVGWTDGLLHYFENTGSALSPAFTERTGAANPFNGVDLGFWSTPTFGDLDGDGDLDAVVGENEGALHYFENTGTTAAPVFTQRTGAANPFDGIDAGFNSTPALADLDGDGDLDAVVGEFNGTLLYFENTGTATAPVFIQRTGASNPFNGVDVGVIGTPTFADLDGDGDLDGIVGENDGILNYFENTGTATAPVFTARFGIDNPFDGYDLGSRSAPSFGDLDGDGDLDAVLGAQTGGLRYLENATYPGQIIYVRVIAQNDAPTAAGLPTDVTVLEATLSDLDLSAVTLTDPDSGSITVVLTASVGTLTAISGGGVTVSNSGSDVLTLQGTAANIDTFLNTASNVQFTGPANVSGDNAATLTITANDGTGTITLGVVNIDITASMSLTDVDSPIALNEADPAIHIDADVTFTDAGVGYDGGNLTVSGLNATDEVSVFNNGTGPGQIGFTGGVVSYEGTDIGTVDPTAPTGSFVILFSASATRAAIEALIETLSYRSTSDVPIGTHALFLQVTNAFGQTSAPVTVAVQFTADVLNGADGDDTLDGRRGNDVINGFEGLDELSGGAGDDRIFGGDDDDTLDGGDADDFLSGGQGGDTLTGGDGRDVLRGDEGIDTLFGEGSDDLLEGGDGDDSLNGGDADDRLFGDAGDDDLAGGDGFDVLSGADGDDVVLGDLGEDILSGGIGIDDLQGGDGDDQLSGDGDNDRIDGGTGIDVAIFKGPVSSYTIQIITVGVVRVIGPEGDDLVLNCEFLQFDDQTVSLVGAGNAPPRIVSEAGQSEAEIDLDEGQTVVTTVFATDINLDGVTYSIAGGADAASFTIDPVTGVLSFVTAPDFEAPTDAGRDNQYVVIVRASDGQVSDLQSIKVNVLDTASGFVPTSKGGGPEICYGPDDVDGFGPGSPQVLPGLSDKAGVPPTPEILPGPNESLDGLFRDNRHDGPLSGVGDAPWSPPLTAWDEGFA